MKSLFFRKFFAVLALAMIGMISRAEYKSDIIMLAVFEGVCGNSSEVGGKDLLKKCESAIRKSMAEYSGKLSPQTLKAIAYEVVPAFECEYWIRIIGGDFYDAELAAKIVTAMRVESILSDDGFYVNIALLAIDRLPEKWQKSYLERLQEAKTKSDRDRIINKARSLNSNYARQMDSLVDMWIYNRGGIFDALPDDAKEAAININTRQSIESCDESLAFCIERAGKNYPRKKDLDQIAAELRKGKDHISDMRLAIEANMQNAVMTYLALNCSIGFHEKILDVRSDKNTEE